MTVGWKGWIGGAFTPTDFIEYVAGIRWVQWRPSFVVVHNTENPTFAAWHTQPGSRWMQGFINYYRDDQKWSGGPHLFVADDVIWVGTPLTLPGVHSPSWNPFSLGVEVIGDYNREPLSADVAQNAASALATIHDALGIDPGTIRFHKEDPETTHTGCPGRNLVKTDLIAAVRAKLAARHAGEHVPARIVMPTSGPQTE